MYPIVAVSLGIGYLLVSVLWWRYLWQRLDPRIRAWVGQRFGITLRTNYRGQWEVVERNQGARGCLIELLQPLFLIPAALLPVVVFGVIVLILSGLGLR